MPKSLPGYRLHKPSGQSYIRINGKLKYLGPHGSEESHRKYAEELAKWQSSQDESPHELSIGQLTLLYNQHCEGHYQKDGRPTSKIHVIRSAMRVLNREFRQLPARDFSPRKFKAVRNRLIESGNYCRNTINDYMAQIRRMVKWAVGEELLPYEKLGALEAVRDLQKGRCAVRESEDVKPVALPLVDAVKPLLPIPLQGAVEFQLGTAARPGEALMLRLGDIDRSGAVWVYRPGSHKTEHHAKDRLILVGPKAQAVIMEHAKGTDPDAYVFAVPGTAGQRPYRRDNYGLAIRRACEVAFDMPKDLRRLKKDAPEELKAQAAAWRAEHVWAPNQLRHTAATAIRKAAGKVEVSKTILGHSEIRTTEIYAQRDLAEAAAIIAKIG